VNGYTAGYNLAARYYPMVHLAAQDGSRDHAWPHGAAPCCTLRRGAQPDRMSDDAKFILGFG